MSEQPDVDQNRRRKVLHHWFDKQPPEKQDNIIEREFEKCPHKEKIQAKKEALGE